MIRRALWYFLAIILGLFAALVWAGLLVLAALLTLDLLTHDYASRPLRATDALRVALGVLAAWGTRAAWQRARRSGVGQ